MNDGKIFWPSDEDRELAIKEMNKVLHLLFDSGPEAVGSPSGKRVVDVKTGDSDGQ